MNVTQERQQRAAFHLERNTVENSTPNSASVGAEEEARRLRNEMQIMNARIL
jgi:hypothetical protein